MIYSLDFYCKLLVENVLFGEIIAPRCRIVFAVLSH